MPPAPKKTPVQKKLTFRQTYESDASGRPRRKATPRKKVVKKKPWPVWLKFFMAAVVLVLLSPFYYAYVIKGFSSSWRWIRDIGEDPNYRTYSSFNIRIPKGYNIHGIDVSYYQGKIDWKKVKSMQED